MSLLQLLQGIGALGAYEPWEPRSLGLAGFAGVVVHASRAKGSWDYLRCVSHISVINQDAGTRSTGSHAGKVLVDAWLPLFCIRSCGLLRVSKSDT